MDYGGVDVSPLEPAFVGAILATSRVAWLVGVRLGDLCRRLKHSWARVVALGVSWLALGTGLLAACVLVFEKAYRLLHPEDAHLVVSAGLGWPMLFTPCLLLMVAGLRSLKHRARRSEST